MTVPTRASLSIIIVTWNSIGVIETCLARVAMSRLNRDVEVLVVDNGSTDGTLERLRAEPDIRLIEAGGNRGFAAGNNIGLAQAAGAYILLLNPDAFVEERDTIEAVARFLDDNPAVAGAGVRLTFADGSHQVGDAGHAPTPLSVLVHGLGLQRLQPALPGLFLTRPPPPDAGPYEVDWICGAFLMVRRFAIERAGPLDERFFLYGEDIEWGCRMGDHGLRLVYLPWLSVLHLQGGGASAGKPPSVRWMDGVAAVYALRNPGRLWCLKLAFAVGFALRSLVYAVGGVATRRRQLTQRASTMVAYARHALKLADRQVLR